MKTRIEFSNGTVCFPISRKALAGMLADCQRAPEGVGTLVVEYQGREMRIVLGGEISAMRRIWEGNE